MRTHRLSSALFAGLLLVGATGSALAQTDAQDQDDHHPADTQAAPAPAMPGDAPGMRGGMSGMMEMMTPEMMQMMMQMMQGMGGQGMAQEDGAQGRMPMMGGMMPCPMMQMMLGDRPVMEMPAMPGGPALLYGMPHGDQDEMTPERVRTLLEQRLARHGNPRLELGEIAIAEDGSITAEIVTVDGSLVQKLAFNRYPGLVRQVVE